MAHDLGQRGRFAAARLRRDRDCFEEDIYVRSTSGSEFMYPTQATYTSVVGCL
jgi:hypothetical protein